MSSNNSGNVRRRKHLVNVNKDSSSTQGSKTNASNKQAENKTHNSPNENAHNRNDTQNTSKRRGNRRKDINSNVVPDGKSATQQSTREFSEGRDFQSRKEDNNPNAVPDGKSDTQQNTREFSEGRNFQSHKEENEFPKPLREASTFDSYDGQMGENKLSQKNVPDPFISESGQKATISSDPMIDSSESESEMLESRSDANKVEVRDEDLDDAGQTGSSKFSVKDLGVKKIIDKLLPKENDDDVIIRFYVHLPRLDGKPIVVGSIEELGNWEKSVVELKEIERNTGCYQSKLVRIPLNRFEDNIHYKYAFLQGKKKTKNLILEGDGEHTNRALEVHGGSQYDIWIPNDNRNFRNDIKEYCFVKIIYDAISKENLKEKIMEYEKILKLEHRLTIKSSSDGFISRSLLGNITLEKRLFLCVLLGYFMGESENSLYGLKKDFQSNSLLETLCQIDKDTFPSDTIRKVRFAIMPLIRHNIDHLRSLEWINIFTTVKLLDPEYEFIDHIPEQNYSENEMNKFLACLRERVCPHIDQTEDNDIYVKIAKWMLKQCNSIKSITEMWTIIVHTPERDIQLREYFKGRVQNIVKKMDSCVVLRSQFFGLSDDLKNLTSEVFRLRSLEFISLYCKRDWSKEHLEAITDLLLSQQLEWTQQDYISLLDNISKSIDLGLLTFFNRFLEFWSTSFKNTNEETLPSICKQWYKQLLDRGASVAKLKDKFVFMAFNHVSLVHPYIGELNVWTELLSMAYDRAKTYPQINIFGSVDKVVKRLVPPVAERFGLMVQELLRPFVEQMDELLLKKIKTICTPHVGETENTSSPGSELHVPNGICEDILYLVMTRLQSTFDSKSYSTEFHLDLLGRARLWITILRSTGCVEKLHTHPHIQEIRDAISNLAELILEENINLYLLQELLTHDNEFLSSYFDSAIVKKDITALVVSRDVLEKIRGKYKDYEQKLDILRVFYTEFCHDHGVTDVTEFLDDISLRNQLKRQIKLKDALLTNNWTMHQSSEDIANRTYKFFRSRTFKNIYNNFLKQEVHPGRNLKVQDITELMIRVHEKYSEICAQHKNWEKLQFSNASLVWSNVSDVEVELDLMNLQREKSSEFIRTLKHLSNVSQWVERLDQLIQVVHIFRVYLEEDDEWLQTSYNDLKDDFLSLGKLRDFFESLEKRLSDINNDICWSLIKEISASSDFISFLRTIADEDLKNLINGVDDSEGRLVQEDTVSSLIQVKQILIPLINTAEGYPLQAFLIDLNHVAKSNTLLASKITLCNSNNMALQNMYNNISNRGEVAKERIKNAVKIGNYIFHWSSDDYECSVTLTYPSKGGIVVINISELQDLRGRALLIAKPTVDINHIDDEEHEPFENIVNDFVIQVDIVLDVVRLSSELIEKGHFSYRESKVSLRGTDELKQHRRELENELRSWETAVNSAQDKYYYLTFFPARHILLFFDYFNQSGKDNCESLCRTLVKYVNPVAGSRLYRDKRFTFKKGEYYRVLCGIGAKLNEILGSLSKDPYSLEDTGERVVSDLVDRGKLFIASCSDKFLIPNVIMSLQINQGACPSSWQLLNCTSSTTSEDISIFIKRCFLAANNGYQDHLFCMANLEVLDFKLQYDLVKKIRSYIKKSENYYLALICCPEKGTHHHILDRFSDFRATNGLSTDAMKKIYKIICNDVICVTSELSGQGKTEWIRQESFRKHRIPRSFLISDGDDFGKLVRRFNKFELSREIDSLHINIISADNPEEINMFLFQLLTFGIVSHKGVIAIMPSIPIFVEVASSTDERLMKSIKFLSCLDSIKLYFRINKLLTSREINSQVQVVCHYLDQYEKQVLDEKNISFQSGSLRPLPSKRCQELLEKHFFNDISPDLVSFRFLEIFINVFADQLVRLSSSSFFRVENLSLMVKDEEGTRTTLFEALSDVSKDFATRSTGTKLSQKQAISDEAVDDQLGNIVPWDDSNHLLVFFLSQAPDSICALYRDQTRVPENVRKLLRSQDITHRDNDLSPWRLDDYRNMPTDLLLQRLEKIARRTAHHIDYPPYAFFLAKVVEVEFYALNLHAGITEEIIFQFMSDSLVHADERDVWLFFDEINTCNHIGLLADLIAHRIYLGKLLSPNVRIFAACNPYRIRTKSVSEAGLQTTSKHEFHRSNLVYEKSKYPPSGLPVSIRSYILALGLSYQSRLYLQDLRTEYRKEMCKILQKAKMYISADEFKKTIRLEQEDYLNRMNLPPNTAKNDALLENVLVMIVCILTKIPLFVIGAPGSSKSLAIRLVSQNLRGSSSSTSDGILKVFDKAYNYQKTSSEEFPVISVVLLDEVGLAETSPYNPLKVLHSLLEPSYPSDGPTVAVVGISNWRLDNSKSSRALLVQRPKLGQEDLVDIAVRLLDNGTEQAQKSSLRPLAKAYSEYEQTGQEFRNFHGLRDYYSLVKSLSLVDLKPENIQMSLARNFGGTERQEELCQKYFGEVISSFNRNQSWSYKPIPVDHLIYENLDDKSARHLMIIGKSDSIVNLLTFKLRERDLDPVIIFGSQFPNDRDDYSYTVLSRIMMCVEAGRPLILTDLDIIYGSLYDLWNQNYIVAGSKDDPKYYTRVALGAYANPMLSVAKNFRCILVMDEKKLPDADPPLLNRFEKQRMTMNDVLTINQRELVDQLTDWAKQMSTYSGSGNFIPSHKRFTLNDLFIGFDPDETIPSLVIYVKKNYPQLDDEEILEKCKETLIWIATSDGIVRAENSSMPTEEIEKWKDVYFRDQKHENLSDYFIDVLEKSMFDTNASERGYQVIINTFSNINTDIQMCLQGVSRCSVIKLSTFKTETEFQSQVKKFWFSSREKDLLVLQCDTTTVNAKCIKLAKFVIEQLRNEYYQQDDAELITKHACIILHMHRDLNSSFVGFNFMSGWHQVTIETLAKQDKHLSLLLYGDLGEIIERVYPFEEILNQELLWCLSCIKYPSTTSSLEHVKALNVDIRNSPDFINLLKERTIDWLRDTVTFTDWQYNVASDKKSLYPYSSFAIALSAHIRTLVRQPIAKLLCALERLSVISTFLNLQKSDQMEKEENEKLLRFWRQMFMDKSVISIEDLQEPKPDGYSLTSGVYNLKFPFSYYFMKQIDGFKRLYDDEVHKLREDPNCVDPENGKIHDYILRDYTKSFTTNLLDSVPNFKTSPIQFNKELYFDDFLIVNCPIRKHVDALSYVLHKKLGPDKVLNPFLLHIYWWNNVNTILVEFQLARMCPIKYRRNDIHQGMNLDEHLIESASQGLLSKFCEGQIHDYDEWQHEATRVLSLCEKIPGTSTLSLHLLQISSDLLSVKSIHTDIIKNIIILGNNEFMSSQFAYTVLISLGDYDHYPRRLFITKYLDIVPIESDTRLTLYEYLFSIEPFPHMSIIILRIFELEDKENKDIFFRLLDDAERTLQFSPRLNIIDRYLGENGLHTRMASLCCDVIQKTFFAKNDLPYSSNYFRHALNRITENRFPLSKLTAIAFLKEFVHQFWNYTNPNNNVTETIDINRVGGGDLDLFTLIGTINDYMQRQDFPLVQSLKYYFLRDLRMREFSMDDVKRFCQEQQFTLPWISSLSWNDTQEIKLPFDPYWSLGDDYSILENSFLPLLNNNRLPFNSTFFKQFSKKDAKESHIALIGLIFNRLHALRASREWSQAETQAAEFLLEKIRSVSHISSTYKETVARIIKDEHVLMRINTNTSTRDLLIKFVIGHVIALHASIPSESSPLAYLLQNIHYCNGSYILTCPSDIESLILNAIGEKLTRYKCICGYLYVIGNCGFTNGRSTCPECRRVIGGANHVAEPGQKKLDTKPKVGSKSKDQTGYIGEPINKEKNESVRSMNPVSYRILHLFVHAIIGSWAPVPHALEFLRKNNHVATDTEIYCMGHIQNDWTILKELLDISDEGLALLLHSILNLLTSIPPKTLLLKGSAERQEWEHDFLKNYVAPQVKNVTETVIEFRNQIDDAVKNSQGSNNNIEREIQQTMPMDKNYQRTYLPNLWRAIGDTSLQSLRAHYFADENNVNVHPFLSVFFNRSENLEFIKYLYPIVKFVMMVSSKLEYRLSREESERQTFREFIRDLSDNEDHDASNMIDLAFNDFARSWNAVIRKVKNYQCHELPKEKPKINYDSPIVFALVEPKDSGIYLCAILEYLIGLQNDFLQEVIAIPSGSHSLNFMGETKLSAFDSSSSSAQRYIRSIQITHAKSENLINYKWDDQILRHSQRNLDAGRGNEVFYDFQKIEELLARQLLSDKVHIETLNDSQMFIEPFHFHMELFKGYMRILSEVKNSIPQQPISSENVSRILGLTSNSSFITRQYNPDSLSFDSASELLSCLEILLCFVKRTLTGTGEMSIIDYVDKWKTLATLKGNDLFANLLKVNLKLKNLVALYELIEVQFANGVVNYISDKYKENLTDDLKEEITKAIDYDQTHSEDLTKIPAEVFSSALKRFILRFLSSESIKEDYPLSVYFTDETLNLWPSFITDELVNEHFPDSLLACHAYYSFKFIDSKLEELRKQQKTTGGASKNAKFQESGTDGSGSSRGGKNNRNPKNANESSSSIDTGDRGASSSRGHQNTRRGNRQAKKNKTFDTM
ncbi:7322_t:CDS:10, partial [Acaulospora morrowiae]